uniref:Uncharacterized protein n=1 Tax=Rhizophora mucronata TaxID=61149 RepID=A0A2P2N124_RHIMU
MASNGDNHDNLSVNKNLL